MAYSSCCTKSHLKMISTGTSLPWLCIASRSLGEGWSPKSPSRSSFKRAIYGLRYYYRHIGQTQRAINLPSLKQEAKLPVILNREEHRIVPLSDFMAKGLKKYLTVEKPHIWLFNGKDSDGRFILRTLDALQECRTSALGGHIDYCDCCGVQRISYNSCGNRHCPKCQGAKQALWVDDRMNDALDCKYFHIVFTVPEELNQICLLDSNLFYKSLFESVWNVLQQFGYTTYGVESGAICVLHTWGQNLSLHPHIHCIFPSAGLTLAGN